MNFGSPVVRLPRAVEIWKVYFVEGGEMMGCVVTSLVFVLVAVFYFFLHRSQVLITFSRLRSNDKSKKHSLLIAATIPTLSICLTSSSVLFPRSSLLLLSLSKLARAAGSYLLIVEHIRSSGGQICAFQLTKLALNSTRSLRDYTNKHSKLSLSITLLTVQVFLTSALLLTYLLLSYDTDLTLYPHSVLRADTLTIGFYTGLVVSALLGMAAACGVRSQGRSCLSVPVMVAVVSLMLLVGEMVMTVTVIGERGDKWSETAVLFLTRHCLMAVLVQVMELLLIVHFNKKILKKCKQCALSEPVEERESGQRQIKRGKIRLRLSRETSLELLEALKLQNGSIEEGIKISLTNRSSRQRVNSLSSIVTV